MIFNLSFIYRARKHSFRMQYNANEVCVCVCSFFYFTSFAFDDAYLHTQGEWESKCKWNSNTVMLYIQKCALATSFIVYLFLIFVSKRALLWFCNVVVIAVPNCVASREKNATFLYNSGNINQNSHTLRQCCCLHHESWVYVCIYVNSCHFSSSVKNCGDVVSFDSDQQISAF